MRKPKMRGVYASVDLGTMSSGCVSRNRWQKVVPKYAPSRFACLEERGW